MKVVVAKKKKMMLLYYALNNNNIDEAIKIFKDYKNLDSTFMSNHMKLIEKFLVKKDILGAKNILVNLNSLDIKFKGKKKQSKEAKNLNKNLGYLLDYTA